MLAEMGMSADGSLSVRRRQLFTVSLTESISSQRLRFLSVCQSRCSKRFAASLSRERRKLSMNNILPFYDRYIIIYDLSNT